MSLNCTIDGYFLIFGLINGLFLVCLCEIGLIWGFRLQRIYGFGRLILCGRRVKVGNKPDYRRIKRYYKTWSIGKSVIAESRFCVCLKRKI